MPCSDSAIAHRTLPLTYARVAETKTLSLSVGGWRPQQLLLLARHLALPSLLPSIHPTHLVLTLPQHCNPPIRPYRILL